MESICRCQFLFMLWHNGSVVNSSCSCKISHCLKFNSPYWHLCFIRLDVIELHEIVSDWMGFGIVLHLDPVILVHTKAGQDWSYCIWKYRDRLILPVAVPAFLTSEHGKAGPAWSCIQDCGGFLYYQLAALKTTMDRWRDLQRNRWPIVIVVWTGGIWGISTRCSNRRKWRYGDTTDT